MDPSVKCKVPSSLELSWLELCHQWGLSWARSVILSLSLATAWFEGSPEVAKVWFWAFLEPRHDLDGPQRWPKCDFWACLEPQLAFEVPRGCQKFDFEPFSFRGSPEVAQIAILSFSQATACFRGSPEMANAVILSRSRATVWFWGFTEVAQGWLRKEGVWAGMSRYEPKPRPENVACIDRYIYIERERERERERDLSIYITNLLLGSTPHFRGPPPIGGHRTLEKTWFSSIGSNFRSREPLRGDCRSRNPLRAPLQGNFRSKKTLRAPLARKSDRKRVLGAAKLRSTKLGSTLLRACICTGPN